MSDKEKDISMPCHLKWWTLALPASPLLSPCVCISPRLSFFVSFSSSLQLLSSANVFSLVSSAVILPLSLLFSPPSVRLIGRRIRPWRRHSLYCEKSRDKKLQGKLNTFFYCPIWKYQDWKCQEVVWGTQENDDNISLHSWCPLSDSILERRLFLRLFMILSSDEIICLNFLQLHEIRSTQNWSQFKKY